MKARQHRRASEVNHAICPQGMGLRAQCHHSAAADGDGIADSARCISEANAAIAEDRVDMHERDVSGLRTATAQRARPTVGS
jgi:hypothetical protein